MSSRTEETSAHPSAVGWTNTLRRSSRAWVRLARPSFSSRSTKPVAVGGVAHLVGDLAHGQLFVLDQEAEEEVLGKGDVALGQILGKAQQETPLKHCEDVSEALGVGAGSGIVADFRHQG